MNNISVGGKWDCLDRRNCTKTLKLKRAMQLCRWNVIQTEMRAFQFEPTASTMLHIDF